ncbi:amino acid permease [[Phormidium ambiguum] IAM M-71]|uniref:Amino acid permease n=1 Tax=[Phormidium ambiguum] IAM M-71 TaxID=454136 RepID=A0A1U7IU34_9CYAN|nr:amino acid permease [Phormidium ambiguum]OKH41030.1 amino acid permease [Phormidium ambiguum IAM M-71]
MSRRTDYSFPDQRLVASSSASPKQALAFTDAIALIVGIVIGAGIFETPALVAANAGSPPLIIFLWLIGGAVSFLGALCWAELATTYPHTGGNYYYLRRAFGKNVAFLFAWARMTVIQTGSIVLLAFVFGDYASQLFKLGNYSSSIYAAIAIISLTALNIFGVQQGKKAQNLLTLAKVVGLILVIICGLFFTLPVEEAANLSNKTSGSWGLSMIFVLLTYGGWNEAAYISAELQNVRQNMVRSLLFSIGIITVIYLLINFAYLQGLGITDMANSQAVAADLMRRAIGQPGAIFLSLLIAISTLGAINATIFTGARTNYALGQDFSVFSFLGKWQNKNSTPVNALIVQCAIALFLVLLGTLTRKGFQTMVDYTAPVFWFFFLLTTFSLFILRWREPQTLRPFQVPFYPITPIIFCLICGYLLYSSLAYTGVGSLVGVAMVIVGAPILIRHNRQQV